jgi:hypothetical protein
MSRRSRVRPRTGSLALVASLAIILSGCASAPSASAPALIEPTPALSSGPSDLGSDAPEPSSSPTIPPDGTAAPTPSPIESASPTPEPTDLPTPTPKLLPLVTGWTTPALIAGTAACTSVDAAIDAAGRTHLVADCGKGFTYFLAGSAGSWATTTLTPPAGKVDAGAQIALDGSTTYIAYQEFGDGGCGTVGFAAVYVRSQATPGGAWSAPTRIGATNDGLESFIVRGGTIYATVLNDNATTYYETVTGSTTHRYKIADADHAGSASLQVGTDGIARVAYWGTAGIRYGVFNGTGFTTSTVVKEDGYEWDPALRIDSANNPRIIWTHSPTPGGCAGPDGTPKDGEYYATLTGSTWTSRRFTADTSGCSFVRDDATGVVTVLTNGGWSINIYTKSGAAWKANTLSSVPTSCPALLLNPLSGALFAAFTVDPEYNTPAKPGIYTMTKPGS